MAHRVAQLATPFAITLLHLTSHKPLLTPPTFMSSLSTLARLFWAPQFEMKTAMSPSCSAKANVLGGRCEFGGLVGLGAWDDARF